MQTPITTPSPSGLATTSAPSTGAQSTALPSGTGTAPSVPPSLATALNNGIRLPAQVAAQTGGQASGQGGNATLSLTVQVPTGSGGGQGQTVPLQVQTALPLPPGTSLTVSLQGSGPPAVLFLQPNNAGQAPGAQSNAAQAGTTQTSTAQAGTARPAVVTSLTQGSIFTATVTSGTASTPATSAAPQAQPTAGVNTPATTQNATAALGVRPAPALPAGATLQVQLLSFAPQGQSLPTGSTTNGFLATVTGSSPSGTTVQTSAGTLSLALPNAPSTGSQLLLSAVSDPTLPTSVSGTASANRFQALQEAVSLLRGGDPAAAQRLTQGLLPQPNAQLGIAAAFLLNAMRQGTTDRWLGRDTARSIDALGGKDGPMGRLSAELSQPPGRATDAAGQEWRVTQLPMMGDGQIDQIKLYTKPGSEDGSGQDGEEAGRGRRFVIEANFSRLGPIQLDGFSRDKQIDMVLRSQSPLEPFARDEIRALFADTISALGYAGTARFQVVPAFDLIPERDDGAPEGFTV